MCDNSAIVLDMDILCINTSQGLKPCYDSDFDEKRKLRIGETYRCKISIPRNYREHKKYFALTKCAWEYLNEKQQAFYKNNIEIFRKSLEILVGHCEPMYIISQNSWSEIPKSVSYDSMNGTEFLELYKLVREALFQTFLKNISMDDFENSFKNFYND